MAFDGFNGHFSFEFCGQFLAFHSALQDSEFILTDCLVFGVHYKPLLLRQPCIDGLVSHQVVRCGFIFTSKSGSLAS